MSEVTKPPLKINRAAKIVNIPRELMERFERNQTLVSLVSIPMVEAVSFGSRANEDEMAFWNPGR